MNEDIVIIIPTKGRQNYLNRIASYYSKFDMHTYICDAYQTMCEVDSYDTIHYLWDSSKGFFEELLDVVKFTNASYYLLAPDDDFIKYETLLSCYDRMKSSPDLAMGSGRQMFFSEKFDGSFIYYDYHNKISESSITIVNKGNASIFERNYQNIHWSIFKRDCLIDALSILDKSRFKYACFAEFIFAIEGIRHGGIYFDNGFFNYREESSMPHWGNVAPSISWKNLLFSKDLREDIKKLRKVYGDEYGFVRKCLISYMNAQFDLVNRLKLKIKHKINGYCQTQKDDIMSKRISDALMHMQS